MAEEKRKGRKEKNVFLEKIVKKEKKEERKKILILLIKIK